MTFIIPQSWQQKLRTLSDLKTPISPIPAGKQIYVYEMTDDVATRAVRLSNNVNSASVMSFAVNQEVFQDEVLYEIFTKTILGGYSPLIGKKVTPLRHPYLGLDKAGLFAKDIVEITSFEYLGNDADKVWANYNLAKVTINFETLDYPVGVPYSPADNFNTNFIKINIQSSSSRVSTPVGWYKFTAGDFINLPALFGSWYTQPLSNIQMTIYHCTRDMLYGVGADATNFKQFYTAYHGYVNSVNFGGWTAGQLLFDTAEIQPYRDYLGTELFNVRLNFVGNQWGFNKSISPGGSIDPIGYVVGGTAPFTSFPFKSFVSLLNPFNSV